MALADFRDTTSSRSVSIRGGVAALDSNQLRSPEQLIDDLSSLLSNAGGGSKGGGPRKENLPPHARAYTIDDDEFDEPMPIPSTWRENPKEEAEKGWFVEQTWAVVLGFAVGLVIIVPAILFATARFGALDDPAKAIAAGGNVALVQLGTASGITSPSPTVETTENVPQAPEVLEAERTVAVVRSEPVLRTGPAPVEQPTASAASPDAQVTEVPEIRVVARPTTRVQVADSSAVASKPSDPSSSEAVVPTEPATLQSKLPTLEEAHRRIALGEVLEARKLLAQLASGGDAEAVFALAETYDPNVLAAWAIQGVPADVGKARLFYSMALSRGLQKARQRLTALN